MWRKIFKLIDCQTLREIKFCNKQTDYTDDMKMTEGLIDALVEIPFNALKQITISIKHNYKRRMQDRRS